MRARNFAIFPLVLVFVVMLASPALGGGYFSVLWADRDQCPSHSNCEVKWRTLVEYRLDWQPPSSWMPTVFTDGDVLLRGSGSETGHFNPIEGWMGAGFSWSSSIIAVSFGGRSHHVFDRVHPFLEDNPLLTIKPTYNYAQVRWDW